MIIQSDEFIHTMNKDINLLYFTDIIVPTEYGYNFYSKRSRVKNKHVIMKGKEIPNVFGEIILSTNTEGFTKTCEIIYYLPDVFKRDFYENKKKYQNRVSTPRNLISKHGIKIRRAEETDIPEIDNLHKRWVERKLSDPRVHIISFSTYRYMRCVIKSLTHSSSSSMVIVAEIDGKIVGVRCVSISGDKLFDAAFFVEFWKISQLSESINVASIDYFSELGFNYLNTGIASGLLKKYKKHLPHTELFVYRKINPLPSQGVIDEFFE